MRILIVEDETRMASLLGKGLGIEGYSVVMAHSGTDALEAAQCYSFDGGDRKETAANIRRAKS